MSKENTKVDELQYFERLNIPVLSINKIKELVKNNIKNTLKSWDNDINLQKQTFHVIGPAGVGKSQICYQIAKELSSELDKQFDVMMIKCPVLSRDDFLIPFPIVDNGNTRFKMLYSDFVPKDKDSFGIFVIDEFSRGDHTLQQLMWQIQNDYQVHLHDLPKGWFVIAIDNPDDQEYSMDILEDAAGLRRMLHLYVEVSPNDFLDYAIKNKFHRAVIEFIQTHPDYIYDFKSQKLGSVYANPASYERISNILIGFENNDGIQNNYDKIESLCSGLLNVSKTRIFMEFLKGMKTITPMDIFYKYNIVKPEVLKLVKSGDNAKLGEVITSFLTFLLTSKPTYKNKSNKIDMRIIDNVSNFLTDIPVDTAAIFVTGIGKTDKNSPEREYMTDLHVDLQMNSQNYKENFYEKLFKLQKNFGG